ncbi:hypothetical protein F5Y10DRAFT_288168 [Nemania abortiva]|nr:hypothetical protein F5Y10DRAFT_288168 [Nemania abortiva]
MTMAAQNLKAEERDGLAIVHVALWRMGTKSMAEAYRILGYEAHHVLDNYALDQPWDVIEQAAEATWPGVAGAQPRRPFKREDWEKLWDPKYEVVTDLVSPFADQLTRVYPKAKVVVVQRDFDSWWPSYKESSVDTIFSPLQRFMIFLAWHVIGRRAGYAVRKINLGFFNAKDPAEIEANARKSYDRYFDGVRKMVSPERRLEYKLSDGWEPLCSFLGKEVPDVQFPRLNDREVHHHDTCWEDDEELREQTKKYKEWALSVVNHVDSPFLPPFARHPWQEQVFNLDAKVCILERRGDQNDHDNKEDLSLNEVKDKLMQWESAPKDITENKNDGRIIILQDLHPRVIELLGVKLGIPPHFFLAHCHNQVNLSVIDEKYSKQDDSTYWKVRVPRGMKFMNQNVPFGDCAIEAGSIIRDSSLIRSPVAPVLFSNAVSCWTKASEPNSWTAVILVDPYRTHIRNPAAPDRYELLEIKGVATPHYTVLNTGTRSDMRQLPLCSIFDTAFAAYDSNGIPHTNDPFEGTILVRNIIRSKWESFVGSITMDVRETYVADQKEYLPHYTKPGEPPIMLPRNTDILRSYQELIVLRQWIMEYKDIMNPILWKFRCKDDGILSQDHANPPEVVDHDYDSLQNALREEKKSWVILDEKFSKMEATVASQMDMWAQRAALQQATASLAQAEASTRSARTSGQLTKIATIIVPCTFVASIFSMNGRFAAGEDLFFVYWTISVPVTLGLLAWVLHEDIRNVYRSVANFEKKLESGDKMAVSNETTDTLRHRKLFHLSHDKVERTKAQV